MTTLGTVGTPQDLPLPDDMDSQPIEAPTPAATAPLTLHPNASPTAVAAAHAGISLPHASLSAASTQTAITTRNPFSILGDDDPTGEFPPLGSTYHIRYAADGTKRARSTHLGSSTVKFTATPACRPFHSNDASSALEDGWHTVSRRRKTAQSGMPHAVSPQSEFLHTVILRPTQPCRIMDAPFLTIDSAIATQTGLQSHPSLQPRYQVRYLDRSNQLAVDATSSQVRDALLKITYIPIDKKQVPVQAYEAIRRGQTRGFIKNAGGMDSAQLLQHLHCRKCTILQARPLGTSGSALITFEGTSLPFRVGLASFTVRVYPFHRQTHVCDTCHCIGHRSTQCPNSDKARCATCGAPKHGIDQCSSAQPKCRNCGGTHLATARSCPKKKEIQRMMAQRDRGAPQRRPPPSSFPEEQPSPPPPVPPTPTLTLPAMPPVAPTVPIASSTTTKPKTDSRPILAAKPHVPALSAFVTHTQLPTSEPPRTFFAEAVKAVNTARETPASIPAVDDLTAMTQQMALLTKQTQAALQQLAAMQQSISTLVDTCTPDLIEKFHLHSPSDTPAAFAIQELNGPLPALPQYDGLAPDAETSASLPRIRAALYVHRSVPFTPLDTSQWCSIITSVTGCRLLLLPRRPVLLFSVYVTPDTSLNRRTRQPLNVAFIKHFSRLYPKDDIIVCGDFNAKHTAWGYDVDLPRGTRLLADLTELKLSLLNTPDTPTRIGQTSRQQDTCPDLSWASFPQRWKWQVTSDHLGSDHLPITLHYHFPSTTSSHPNTRRDTFITKLDKFRAALVSVMDVTGFSDIIQAIQCAHKAATKRLTVPEDAPAPDAHLLTLWNRRIRLLARYRRSGRPRRLLRVLRQVQDTISSYTSELASDRWTSIIRILGFHLDQDSRAATWFQRTISTSKQLNHLLYRVAHRSRGVHEHDLRIFARAFVVSRIMYGYPYYHITRTQQLRLEIINRELQRIVTGLPRYTRIDALTSCSQMNSLDDLASTQIATQETRLRATLAGRFTLRKLGYNIDHLLPLPTPPPPWELCPLTAPRPLPRNMGEKAQARRSDFARRHLHSLLVRSSSALVFYADAAVDNNSTPIFSTAWCDVDGHRRGTQVFMTPCSSSHAELCAILHCLTSVNTFTLVPSSRIVIYTDSQEAIRALRHSSPSSAIAIQIHRAAISIRTAGHHPLIDWVPAHSGIPGNERAHRLARAKLLSARAGAPTFPTPPELTPGSFHDSHEARQEHASQRRHYLTTQANPLDFPSLSHLPLTRHETSLLEQARSGALLAPSLLAKMYPQVHINPQCTHCHIPASLPHLLWDCPLHSTARVRALSTLSPPPSTLTEWLNPLSAPDPGRVLAAFQAILRYLEDPQAPPLGSRLLKHYEPIIAAARRLSAPGNTRDT
ncbi:hypothetical protein HPB47_010784 [Ixodes persulcatus]|uniref:Uncharacterized protein n=1 Tax=Ixodes persulcatus TaxID=34615 RepID=A0AC60NY42_IXOPE|nr:hypothetical protein HPB47_010784 [Ixodes persulcatus]